MFSEHSSHWSAEVSLGSTLLWLGLAALAGTRHAPLGVIELLVLFATLVAVGLIFPRARPLLWLYALTIAASRVTISGNFSSIRPQCSARVLCTIASKRSTCSPLL